MTKRMLLVGTGGWGSYWSKWFLPPNIEDGHIEVVAAADLNEAALINAQNNLGLRRDQCYTNLQEMFDQNQADFCAIVVPPAFHEQVVDLALAHDLDVLSEKPIADTLEASVRVAAKLKQSGKKMAVTMSHRFDQDKSTLRRELRSGNYGALDYLMMRFTCDCRQFASWGKFRHEIIDPLLIEGSVHHLDILADLAGAKCDTIYAQTWNPTWGEYAGDSQALVTMHFENGTRAFYEGAKSNAIELNGWTNEYIRAECQNATVVMEDRHVDVFDYNPGAQWAKAKQSTARAIPLIEQKKWANTWLIERFVHWLEGGEALETDVESNLQSVALVFAAIESSRTGQPVKTQELLQKAMQIV